MKNQTTKSAPIEIALRHSFSAAAVSLALFIAGCGGGGGASAPAAVSVVSAPAVQGEAAANSFNITNDSYGMTSPTFLEASKTPQGITLESALASRMTDPNYKTVSRIDIPTGSVSAAGTYSLGAATPANPAFAGAIYFFNGHPSTQLSTVGGTITFSTLGSNPGDRVSGSFNATVQDGADSYTIAGSFDLSIGSSNLVLPAPPPAPLAAGSRRRPTRSK